MKELVASLADIVSKNGNLLLGLEPMADGSFPTHQVKVVKLFGDWLKINGEAIYGTRPYIRFDGETANGQNVRYTTKAGKLYAIILGNVEGDLVIKNLKVKSNSHVELLGYGHILQNDMGGFQIDTKTDPAGSVLKFDMGDIEHEEQ